MTKGTVILHPASSVSFTTNGLGNLSDYTEGIVVEEINGMFELTLKYPIFGIHYNDITMRRILYAKPNPYSTPQPFRIYAISKPINGIVTINAAHLSYDLSGIPVTEFEATSATDALNKIKNNSLIANPFQFNSTVTTTGTVKVDAPRSARSVLGNNVLRAFGGEYEFDNLMVYHRPKRGINRGFSIRYGKNLLDINQEENIANVYTGVYPFWIGEDEEGTKVVVKLPEKIVKVEGTFDFERIFIYDVSEDYYEQPTETQMRDATLKKIKSEKIGIPTVSIDASFIQLSKSSDYKNFAMLEQVELGDELGVEFSKLGINAEARCVKTIYNIATDSYDNVELGDAKSNLATTISDNKQITEETIAKQQIKFDAEIGAIKIGIAEIDKAIIEKVDANWVSANFAHLVNGYIDNAQIKDLDAGTITTGDLEADVIKTNVIEAVNMRTDNATINAAKIGNLSADKITTGDLDAERIKAGVIEAINISTDTATINSAKIGNLSADKITTGDLDAERIMAKVIEAVNMRTDTATINSAKIGNLSADKITTGDLSADRIKTSVITAINASIGSATIDSAKIGNLDASKITTGFLSADRIEAGSIDAGKIDADVINTIGLNASEIVSDKIAAGEIKVGDINIVDGTISFAKITKVKITNAMIDEAFIADAYIKNITADVIKGGTLDAKNMIVTNLSAESITVGKINGTQIANGTITSGNLDEILNKRITSTETDIQKALEDMGIVKTDVKKANDTASSANTRAEEAYTSAGAATALANTAKSTADTANTTAGTAQSTANTAKSTADAAKTAAGTAQSTANTAKSTADAAKTAADTANQNASAAITAANGKNKVFYQNAAPSTSVDLKVNDTWFDTDDGNRIYRWDGSTWVTTQLGQNAIANAAIVNAHITDATITSAKIAALDAGKITSGTILADRIGALSITAAKIAAGAITTDKIDANAVTAAKIAAGTIQTSNLAAGLITTDKLGANVVTSAKIDTDELFVGDNAFINKLKAVDIDAANITTGTISNERINITGLISFEAFDKTLQPIFNVQGDKTYINGGMIATNTIKADKIDLLSGLTVQGANGKPVFNISRVGDTDTGTVEIDGLLKSSNFDEDKNTGYQISTDGVAILNQARISGEFIMPNAGMTNYGATIGNENLIMNTTDQYQSYATGQYYYNVAGKTLTLSSLGLKAGDTITFSVYVKATENKGVKARISCYTGDGTYDTVMGNVISVGEEGISTVTYTLSSNVIEKGIFVAINSASTGDATSAIGYFKEAKLEISDVRTPWCPAVEDQFNYTRIWAGTSYENRDNAPFRVLQNGDVYAKNGTYEGLLKGILDSGDVQIYNNAITVHTPGTETEVVNISATRSKFNSDFIMGIDNVIYSKGNKKLSLVDTTLDVASAGGRLMVTTDSSETGGVNIIGPTGGQHILRGSTTLAKTGSLFLDSQGTSSSYGDFVFVRKNQREDVKVVVDGDLNVKTKISSSGNGLELRVKDDGWGFYAI